MNKNLAMMCWFCCVAVICIQKSDNNRFGNFSQWFTFVKLSHNYSWFLNTKENIELFEYLIFISISEKQ